MHGGNIEAGEPHVDNDGDLHGVIVVLELTSQFFFVVLGADNLFPVFGVIVAAGHNDTDLFLPAGSDLHQLAVNLHGDRAGVCHDHCLTCQQIGAVAFVVGDDIIHQ